MEQASCLNEKDIPLFLHHSMYAHSDSNPKLRNVKLTEDFGENKTKNTHLVWERKV